MWLFTSEIAALATGLRCDVAMFASEILGLRRGC